MTDQELVAEDLRFRRENPQRQRLHAAIKRERKARNRKASQQGNGNGKDDR